LAGLKPFADAMNWFTWTSVGLREMIACSNRSTGRIAAPADEAGFM